MAEISLPFTNEKHGVEMEPTISTPLQQETKRKRPQNNEADLTRRKKPRKKMYRPKVIGEGRPRKSRGSNTPAKCKQVTPNPKTPKPVTPNRVLPKPRTRKLRPLPKPRTRKLAVPKSGCQKNRSEKSTELLEDDNRANAIVSCRDLVVVENELKSEKAFAEVAGIEAKEAEEDSSKSIVIHTRVGSTEMHCRWLCAISQECKRKRTPRRLPRTITERKPYGLGTAREKCGGSRKKLLSFFFSQRKRTPMVRRCNLASLFALPDCNQLPRNTHKHAVKSIKAEHFNGNDIVPVVGWLLKRPNQLRNRKKSQASSNLKCSSRDDGQGTKIEEADCQSSSTGLKANGRDSSVGTAITDVYNEGTVATKASAQTELPPASSKLSDMQSEGASRNLRNFSKLINHNGQLTMRWLDISHFLTNSKLINGGSEKNPPEKGLSVPRMITGLQDVARRGSLIRQQDFTLSVRPSGSANETRPTLKSILWNRSERTRNNHEHIRFTGETRANNKGILGEATDSLSKKLLVPYAANGRYNEAQFRNVPLSVRPSGSANQMIPTLNSVLWNRSEGTKNDHEHIGLTRQTKANNKGILGEETDSICKKLLVPYVADGRYNEAQFRNVPTYVGTGNSSGLSQKEGTDLGNDKQIIPYARKGRKKTSKQELNPSFVHSMQGAIIPHPKSLNSTKKKELDRVYLDPRDITVWKLLIQNESNFGKEKIDADTEKWWTNEREVFRGRIDAFNAIMHVILGDRRFSPWKGSVVDSVVGVFLTQNVSDHLSSSAYMSLAATFPLLETRNHTENYQGQEVLSIQQSAQRKEGFFLCESKWNDGSMLENNKTTGDPEKAEELMSAISSQDFLESSVKETLDLTLRLSSTCLEDDCGTCLSTNLDGTDNTVLHSNKLTFLQEPYSSSQTSTSSCGSNQENKTSESNDMDCRNQNPISKNLNLNDTMHMLRSSGNCYFSAKCISKSNSGLENNTEDSNRCEGTMEVDLQFTPNEKSQRFIGSVEKFQNQEIQLAGDANAKCCLGSECRNQTNNGVKKTTENYSYYQEETEAGSQLSGDIGDASQKLDIDVEKFQSQESVIQANDNANDTEEKENKGAQIYLEDRNSTDFNDERNTEISKEKAKKSKMKQEIDWNSLREKWDSMRKAFAGCEPRSHDHMDSVDWEAVRSAEPSKISDAIRERGQHNIIAGRIKEFLDRIARIHGCIDLEWLRTAPPNDVKGYLLEIDGLGLKSVECIRLLALRQVAFPVDINVGRIAVRLGWVPLEPLPEEVQMHLLETFPMMDSIQKYLWPRLRVLDQRTLYELHYQLITFGKVFCTKRKPNCNACPLRAECRHYASAYASARLALPGLPEKRIARTMVSDKSFEGTAQVLNPASVLHIDDNPFSGSRYQTNNCEPIIEEPPSPQPEYDESQLTDIEDLCEYDSDDVPIIRLSSGRFTTTSQNCMVDNSSKALVPLHAKVASIPMRKLKHIDRLRTEHQAYELPDTHPLLSGLERREPNDPFPYLLCILSPGESVDSSEPPNTTCTYQVSGEFCTEGFCSSCSIAREQNSGIVRGTILIPCRTAMRGKFPLNGTYFQVNEVFADDESSKDPIPVPREWIWDLPRRITYFGTSTTTIFRGLAKEDIQYCFQKGFICVRGFDRKTRTPKRLAERLHRPTHASVKARANKNEDQRQKTQTYASNSNSPQ